MRRELTFFIGCLLLAPAIASASNYMNPVGATDLPDPSVIRTGNGYWATATSSEWAPHFPLLYSKDLVNWEPKGWALHTTPSWAKSSFWAPEITEYRGTYFIYYTARRHDGRLAVAVATAPKPEGPYTDHGELVAQEMGSIDAMAFTDVKGQRWLLWKEDGNSRKKPTPIFLQSLSEDGLKLVGERRQILTNDAPWEGNVVEGPFVLRHGDYYYLFYSGAACCGRGCNYALGVARSKQMEGPWEKAPSNPILAYNEQWRCPGHGSIVQDPDGRYWLLYHSYAQKGFVATGRQMLLDEVVFNADGWPSINGGRGPSREADAPKALVAQQENRSMLEQFDAGATLAPRWQWPIGREPKVRMDAGWLTIAAGAQPLMLAQSIRNPSFVAETSIRISGETSAGLGIFGNESNYITLIADGTKLRVLLHQRAEQKEFATVPLPQQGEVKLRIASLDGSRFRFAFSNDGGPWTEISGEADGDFLPPWDRAVRIGFYVAGPTGGEARFDYYKLRSGGESLLVK